MNLIELWINENNEFKTNSYNAFHLHQIPDAKDLHHLSLVSSYGTHLLHGFQPHFFNQHLNPAVSSANSSPFGSGGAFVKPFPSNLSLPSAFQPPKCLGFGLDQVSIKSFKSFESKKYLDC